MDDLTDGNKELPRAFTSSVTRAVIVKDENDIVSWSDFSVGFPLAVRQRRVLWNQFNASQGDQVERDQGDSKVVNS